MHQKTRTLLTSQEHLRTVAHRATDRVPELSLSFLPPSGPNRQKKASLTSVEVKQNLPSRNVSSAQSAQKISTRHDGARQGCTNRGFRLLPSPTLYNVYIPPSYTKMDKSPVLCTLGNRFPHLVTLTCGNGPGLSSTRK